MSEAYWVSPQGVVIDIPMKHIGDVIAHPSRYGYTSSYIKNLYKQYGEKLGQEGHAREQIMLALIKKGWVRIRKRMNSWTVQAWRLDSKTSQHVLDWVFDMLKSGDIHKNSQLDIHELNGNKTVSMSASEAPLKLESIRKSRKKKVV